MKVTGEMKMRKLSQLRWKQSGATVQQSANPHKAWHGPVQPNLSRAFSLSIHPSSLSSPLLPRTTPLPLCVSSLRCSPHCLLFLLARPIAEDAEGMNLQGPWFAVALTAPGALTVVETSLFRL